ncbi:MAG: DUF4097 domain-containing protein [Lachnospiraceae bacterium]|nr:DUF4097 domain-containing protein [Lachnospiraceae bacterium]
MKKAIIAIVTAAALIVCGTSLCGISYAKMGNDLSKLGFVEMEKDEVKIEQEFQEVTIRSDIAAVTIQSTDQTYCSVECYQDKKAPFDVRVENGALVIDSKTREDLTWYERASVFASTPKVIISLPKKDYGTLLAKMDTGNLKIEGPLTFESMDLTMDTGDVHLSRTITSKELHVKMDTGNFTFEDCDAGSVSAELDTGNIEGSFLSPKAIEAKSDTGSVHVPKQTEGGACRLKTDTGNIRITIAES